MHILVSQSPSSTLFVWAGRIDILFKHTNCHLHSNYIHHCSNTDDGAVAEGAPNDRWLCESALLASEPAPCDIVCQQETTVLELFRTQFVEALLVLSTDAAGQGDNTVGISTVGAGDESM
jgi:hypothetical protein